MEQPLKEFDEYRSLSDALETLSRLSYDEYGVKLPQLLGELSKKNDRDILRFSRLLGVMLKEPFSEPPYKRTPANEDTGALQGWIWNPDTLLSAEAPQKWQYDLLMELLVLDGRQRSPQELKSFVDHYAHEGGLGLCLLNAVKDHLCGDPKAKKKIEDAINEAKAHGVDLVNPTPQRLIPATGMGLCGIVAVTLPYGVLLGPIVGSLTILLLHIGLDGFCAWVSNKINALGIAEVGEQERV